MTGLTQSADIWQDKVVCKVKLLSQHIDPALIKLTGQVSHTLLTVSLLPIPLLPISLLTIALLTITLLAVLLSAGGHT